MNIMIPIYVSLIKKGKKTIEQVPENLRAEVEEALKETNSQTSLSHS